MILLPPTSYPLTYSETWKQLDSTKIKEYMRCPRRFFWRYVAGWQLEAQQESVHLVFGQAWHLALELLLKKMQEAGGYKPALVQEAYDLFHSHYREAFPEEQDESNSPKNPANALSALVDYSKRFENDYKEMEVLYTEITGVAPISENRHLVFKIDAVCKDISNDLCFVLEHKTSQQMTQNWADQWALSVQVGTYCHALYCMLSSEKVYGAKVNGAFLRKKGNDFMRVPIRKTKESIQQWLENVNYWYDSIEQSFDDLSRCSENDDILTAFPMNTEACMDWGRTCPYHDFCVSWNNPLSRIKEGPQQGFEINYWNPLEEHMKTAKLVEI